MKITSYPKIKDIDKCEDEPIHLLPEIQSHGCVLVLDADLKVIQESANVMEFIDYPSGSLLNKRIKDIFSKDDLDKLMSWVKNPIDHNSFIVSLKHQSIAIPHISDDFIVIDIEPAEELWDASLFQQKMLVILNELHVQNTQKEIAVQAAHSIKELLEYDRVMIYKFDDRGNGSIIAESKNEELTSWLGLHYPAKDVPANARKIFLQQRVRILSDVNESYHSITPIVNPNSKELTSLGKSYLRGSSPFHIEYLRNMKVGATLNCAIENDGKLWGLIACHHYSPKYTNFQKRQSCQFLSEMIANQLHLKGSKVYLQNIERTSKIRSALVTNMSLNWDIIAGLSWYDIKATDLLHDTSFAMLYDGEVISIGNTPPKEEIQRMAEELYALAADKEFYASSCVSNDLSWLKENAKQVSGTLYYRLSRKRGEALMWFRPEQITTVNWGGHPDKTDLPDEAQHRLSPRKSFEKWAQEVSCTSKTWEDFEINSAKALVEDIRNLIVTKFGEISQLNRQLLSLNEELESFSYSVSHDLRGPLRGIDGFAQILLEDYQEVLDDYGKSSLNIIINSAKKMNDLMDDILGYSGLGKAAKIDDFHDVNSLCQEILKDNQIAKYYPNTQVSIQEDMPSAFGDKAMMYQLFNNLITNAFKYSSKSEQPHVEIGYEEDGENTIYYVRDNGIGFKKEYAKKVFGVFTRLVKEEFKGTGVGLAIAQRIVLRHHGQIWAESDLGKGATFKFYIQNKNA